MNEKSSIVFYKSFYEAIKNIPEQEQLKIYNAIFQYSFYGKEQSLEEGVAKALYIVMKPNIDSANARYNASVENGKKGGRPKIKTQKKPKQNLDKTQQKPKQNLNDNVDDNVDDNYNINNIVKTFNEKCFNLSKIKKITDKRKKAIDKFLKEYTQEQFEEMCIKANESDFLTGKNDRGWKADFDFLLRTDKAISILEGKYDNTKSNKTTNYNNYKQREYDNLDYIYANK